MFSSTHFQQPMFIGTIQYFLKILLLFQVAIVSSIHKTLLHRRKRLQGFCNYSVLICNTISKAGRVRARAMRVYAILGEGLILTMCVSQTSFRKWADSDSLNDSIQNTTESLIE